MLAQVALIVFALCAVLSLIIDIGYARITQVQMQNAADAAAIEGVRGRNAVSGEPNRAAARDVVARVFDDDLDPTNGDPEQFGAGPIIDLTDGATRLHAHQTMSVPDPHVYKPVLELNQDNAIQGDMVRGTFTSSSDPAPPEDQGYNRTDFTPNAAGTAFLVRLRRSNEGSEQDVASSGPSLPLTFGKGTLIGGDDPSSTYSPRRDGLTVRATAIATSRPALRVGLPQLQANPPMAGVTPFALRDTFVPALTAAPPMSVTIDPATGLLCPGQTCTGVTAATAIGRFVTNPNAITTVGQVLPAATPVACLAVNSFAANYGAVYSTMASGTNRIIGFARISFARGACPAIVPGVPGLPGVPGGPGIPGVPGLPGVPTATFPATMARPASVVGPANATANLIAGLPLPANTPSAEIAELLDKNRVGPGRVNYGPVLVPVLAR